MTMEEITSRWGFGTNDPKLIKFHKSRLKPIEVICIKDDPPGTYIDRATIKKGDILLIEGLVGRSDGSFEVVIPSVNGFYNADYFEPLKKKK